MFRCVCFVHIHQPQRDKHDPRALRCVFIGYSTTKGYRCYHPPSRWVFCTMDVTFPEEEPYYVDSPQFARQGDDETEDTEDINFLDSVPLPLVPLMHTTSPVIIPYTPYTPPLATSPMSIPTFFTSPHLLSLPSLISLIVGKQVTNLLDSAATSAAFGFKFLCRSSCSSCCAKR